MDATLYYPEDTSQDDLDAEKADGGDLSSRDVTDLDDDDWAMIQKEYGIPSSFNLTDFNNAATDSGSFTAIQDPNGAQGLQASMLMGMAAVLSAFAGLLV